MSAQPQRRSAVPPEWRWQNRFFRIGRGARAEIWRAQGAWLIVFGFAALAPLALHSIGEETPRLAFGCLFQRLSALPCPFCGYTRALAALGRGDWSGAAAQAPLSLPLVVLVWGLFLVQAAALLGRWRIALGPAWTSRSRFILTAGVIVFLLADWGYRILVY